tara:strand:+ start:793 stop:1710 length:918 start_codon:yes stop_codon:yes gene_type:complete
MTKTFKEGEVIGYDLAKTFQATVVNGGFDVLQGLANSTNRCVIRGTPKVGIDCSNFRRKLDNIEDKPVDWVLMDYDGARPEYAPDLLDDPEGAALALLPDELKGVGFYWQLGSSAGVKVGKYSIHIWIELDKPLMGSEIKPALLSWGFDGAMAGAVQPHYVAAPVFEGMEDPVERRCGFVDGDKAKIKPFIIASMAHNKAQADKRVIGAKYDKTTYSGPRADIGQLLNNELGDLITKASGDLYLCNCPRHVSDGRESLHIEPSKSKWYCHGCKRGGKTAYSLAYFVCNDDKEATKIILNRCQNVI